MPHELPPIQTHDYGIVNIITRQVTLDTLLLKGEDLSQLLQSLTDRIKVLETKPPHVEVTEPLTDETVIV